MDDKPIGAGKSSFDLVDAEILFSALRIGSGMTLLDLGCGKGNYALAAWERLGETGRIYAVDLWKEGVDALRSVITIQNINAIRPIWADASKELPLEDESVDICLLGTVYHDLVQAGSHKAVLAEIRRVLKPEGRLGLVEFKLLEGPPGPPLSVRVGPDELAQHTAGFGFVPEKTLDLGPYVYVSIFRRS
ncbi:class I SAM-dependent methyltransferase [Desulfovibrio inopinatus]|uniref:class I SAM-dependent methyltransferase n=1 Tax=Desulfovibrio inopinatus TaxID=102109 RepID=UPI000427AF3A|nr:class I SAM-dependent methyltransferase [Desulfovibrio inopinatus]